MIILARNWKGHCSSALNSFTHRFTPSITAVANRSKTPGRKRVIVGPGTVFFREQARFRQTSSVYQPINLSVFQSDTLWLKD
jgi:hypothetical protein